MLWRAVALGHNRPGDRPRPYGEISPCVTSPFAPTAAETPGDPSRVGRPPEFRGRHTGAVLTASPEHAAAVAWILAADQAERPASRATIRTPAFDNNKRGGRGARVRPLEKVSFIFLSHVAARPISSTETVGSIKDFPERMTDGAVCQFRSWSCLVLGPFF